MRFFKISLTSLLLLGLAAASREAAAQPGPNPVVNIWSAGTPAGSGTGNWNVPTNWMNSLGAQSVPNVANEDAAIINGGGTAQLNSVASFSVGSVVLGQGTAAGESGTLELLSGGSLTAVDDPSFPADGSVRVGQNTGQGLNAALTGANPQPGTGTLRVHPGGTLTSVSLTLGGTANSSMILGGTGAGIATVNTGAVTLGRTTRVIGPNVSFNSSGTGAGITFQGTSILIPEITAGFTSSTPAPLKTTGVASLGGTLQADFTGVTPMVGQSWNILDADSVTGAFASILPDPDTPLGAAQRIATRTVAGGTNGQLVQMIVQQMPVLTVDRATGATAITNPGATGVELDGYTIHSPRGNLRMANWQSLEDNPGVAGAGWFEANPKPGTRLSELRSGSTSTLAGGGSWGLGSVYQPPAPTQFGELIDDLVFQYNDPVTQSTVDGIINYTGSAGINNLVLFADPATGNVKIRNTSPFDVQIDGYTIISDAGSLNATAWNSLDDQNVPPNWFEATTSDDSRVSEIMSSGTTTLNANGGTTFDLGGLFRTAGARDLVFQFLLAGNSQPNTGVVLYEAAPSPGLTGDFSGNGSVENADLTLLLDNWGQPVPPVPAGWVGDPPTPPAIDNDELTALLDNWGASQGSASLAGGAAVPEPTALVLWAIGMLGLMVGRSRAV